MTKIYDFETVDRCLYWKKEKILIVGDLHLGYEDNLNQRGIVFPKKQQEENFRLFQRVFLELRKKKIEKILLLGDIKHYFGGILRQESQDFDELIRFFENELDKKVKIEIVKGNHDKILEPIIKKYENVTLQDYLIIKNTLFFHGDPGSLKKVYEIMKNKKIEKVVVGHFHPVLVLKDKEDVKKEKYKCFLYGFSKEYNKEVVFVPSFFPLLEGSDIIKETGIYQKGMKVVAIDEEGESYLFKKIS